MLRKNELVNVVANILREEYEQEWYGQAKAAAEQIVERILSHIQGDNQRRP